MVLSGFIATLSDLSSHPLRGFAKLDFGSLTWLCFPPDQSSWQCFGFPVRCLILSDLFLGAMFARGCKIKNGSAQSAQSLHSQRNPYSIWTEYRGSKVK